MTESNDEKIWYVEYYKPDTWPIPEDHKKFIIEKLKELDEQYEFTIIKTMKIKTINGIDYAIEIDITQMIDDYNSIELGMDLLIDVKARTNDPPVMTPNYIKRGNKWYNLDIKTEYEYAREEKDHTWIQDIMMDRMDQIFHEIEKLAEVTSMLVQKCYLCRRKIDPRIFF